MLWKVASRRFFVDPDEEKEPTREDGCFEEQADGRSPFEAPFEQIERAHAEEHGQPAEHFVPPGNQESDEGDQDADHLERIGDADPEGDEATLGEPEGGDQQGRDGPDESGQPPQRACHPRRQDV